MNYNRRKMRSYKPKRKAGRSTIAILLSLVLILSFSGITALAADIPEAAADQVSEEKPDVSSEASDQGELSDEDISYEDPAEQTGSNEETVPSEQGPEEASEEGSDEEEAETPSDTSPAQEGTEGEAAETPSENSPEQEGTEGEDAEQQPSDEYIDPFAP